MDSSHIVKLLSIYGKGVITAPEFANGVLVDLIKHDGPVVDLASHLANLPDEVRRKLEDLLRHIERADYHWRPFVFGPGGPIRDSATEDATRLRQICMMLGIARSPEPSIPQ